MQREHPLEKAREAGPCVLIRGRALGGTDEFPESILEDGVDQVFLGREVTVERPHPDARAAGDLLDWNVHALAREQLAPARDEALTVAASVAAKALGVECCCSHVPRLFELTSSHG